MEKKLFTHAAASVLIAGLVLASGVAAQERARPRPGGPDREVGGWLSGFGASIGAGVRDASTAEVTAAGLAQPGGAFVTQVTPDGPAARAGLAAGDIVTEFDGERVRSAQHLVRLIRESATGRGVRVVYVRDKARRTADLTPTDRIDDFVDLPQLRRQFDRATRELSQELPRLRRQLDESLRRGVPFGERRRFGVELMPLSEQLAGYFGVKDGLLVVSVQDDSPAARSGVRAGDVVLTVNGRAVGEVWDFSDEIARSDGAVTLTVMRDKKEVTLEATLPERTTRARARGRPA